MLLACQADPYELIGAPKHRSALPTATPGVLIWHADATLGERTLGRSVLPRIDTPVSALAHGDPDDLLRRAVQSAAGGVGPEIVQLPGEWLSEAIGAGVVRPLPADEASALLKADEWAGGLVQAATWQGDAFGAPAAPHFRQPFFNDELLRNAGLVQGARTTPPSTWAEYADVCKRVAAPEERWGALLPSHQGDEELFLHVYQHVTSAGGDLPRPADRRIKLDTPPLRQALELLTDLVRNRGALPADRPRYLLAETGKVGLWWAGSQWLAGQIATGNKAKFSATLAPRATATAGRGILLRSRLWALGAHGRRRDQAMEVLRQLSTDATSHAYCAGLSLPPARRANAGRPPYRPAATPTPNPAVDVWPAILDQLGQPDNRPLVTFPGYRPLAGRLAGEFMLVLTGKKPLDGAMLEGEAGANEILRNA